MLYTSNIYVSSASYEAVRCIIPKDHNKNCAIADPKTVNKCSCSCNGLYHGIASQKKLFQFEEVE